MAKNYDSIDLNFSWTGDYLLRDGDLQDTFSDPLLSFKNEVFSTVKSDLKDWREAPQVGADLGDFVGEPNTQNTAIAIQNRIRASLGLIANDSDLEIRVVPVGVYRVLCILRINVMPTPENKLKSGDSIVVSFLYDYFEKGIFTPLDDLNKFGNRVL